MVPNEHAALVMNAWKFPSAIRHQVIFALLDALPPQRALVLINDHDPRPLFYQLDAEQPGTFTWTPTEAPDPNYFAVVITRSAPSGQIPVL